MRIVFLAALTGVLCGCDRSGQVPELKLTGVDPIVATQITNTVAELKHNQRSGAAWGKLGMVLKTAGFPTEARECFVRAETFDTKNPHWPYFQDTIDSLQRALALQPLDFLQIRLAQLYMEAGRWSDASEHFRAAGHSLGLAQVACAQGKWEQALPHLQQARQNKYMAQGATALLATVNLRLGRVGEARALSAQANDMPPDIKWPNAFDAELKQYAVGKRAWIEQAQEALGQGDLPAAGPIIERLVTHYPGASEGWLYLGRACVIQSNLVSAEQ
ncbi:MAG TPA: tetratricopeptide repeat protein, partial [Verrucomicrobiae bacterium]|nr:tetratricopeptide repeat protein [Verrucomicrobiae bacterium]